MHPRQSKVSVPFAGDRRSSGRMMQTGLVSSLGPVVEISRGGMRVRTSRRLQGDVVIKLDTSEGKMRLTATVVHSRRMGLFKHEVGLAFMDLSEEDVRQLLRIALAHGYTKAA